MIYGIIVTHGNLGQELINTAQKMTGNFENICAVSNAVYSTDGLVEEILNRCKAADGEPVFVFTEAKGGSTYFAARKAARSMNNIFVISGINIPMLISFFMKREQYEPEELGEILVNDARKSIEFIKPMK